MAPVKKAPADDFRHAVLGRWRNGLNELRDAHANLPGAAARTAATVDALGKLVPTSGANTVDTFQGAASDFLDFVSLGAVDDGLSVAVAVADPARRITLRHLMPPGADPDAGPLFLRDGQNQGDELLLDDANVWLRFQR